jgi:hypothetical protein
MSAACLQHPRRFFPLHVSVPLSLEAPCWLRPLGALVFLRCYATSYSTSPCWPLPPNLSAGPCWRRPSGTRATFLATRTSP